MIFIKLRAPFHSQTSARTLLLALAWFVTRLLTNTLGMGIPLALCFAGLLILCRYSSRAP